MAKLYRRDRNVFKTSVCDLDETVWMINLFNNSLLQMNMKENIPTKQRKPNECNYMHNDCR